jgi:hypothetical protein
MSLENFRDEAYINFFPSIIFKGTRMSILWG